MNLPSRADIEAAIEYARFLRSAGHLDSRDRMLCDLGHEAQTLLIQRNQLRYYLATMIERKARPFEAEEQAAILKLLEETKG